ncbi:enterotoxin [Yersinia ruckeri]|uniref:enterotoxin n=1 Tax=Yersinia ruckeri TaxID=29486 RepID=UPI001F2B111D|nr:enterotoxin [Yersinia ruckeri]MCK8560675.1 enterotoxin [Yersinia ruckeri]MCW6542121.1 enterotoxin [Yersinia ruckeri]MCW6544306.1 enterotoxin [Yersinia ruckeri]MCW6548484.1 enterotoxin [Yersinia ruckeri]MCW6564824.1 enterotoxin [Yersinia ruckeri]
MMLFLTRKLIVCVVYLFLININASLANPPQTVWRVDTRDFGEVFRYGFSSLGNNDSVLEHLSGSSCRSTDSADGDTAFISTTSSYEFALNYAERVLRRINESGIADTTVYIYQIRATDNMYSAEQSLEHLLHSSVSDNNDEARRILRFAPYLSEWMTHRRIAAEQIEFATPVYFVRGGIRNDGHIPNSRFVRKNTQGNPDPYRNVLREHPYYRAAQTWMLRAGVGPMISACFGINNPRRVTSNELYPAGRSGRSIAPFSSTGILDGMFRLVIFLM